MGGCKSSSAMDSTKNQKDQMMGEHLKEPSEITAFPKFPEGTTSHLSKQLTRDVWNKCKGKKDKCGFTFEQAIFSGAKYTNSGVGVYAGCHDSYTTFAPLFDKIIEAYHGHKPSDKHISSMNYEELNCPPFDEEALAMIKSTRIRVARNLADYPLGSAISREDRKKVEELVTSALKEFEGDLAGTYYSLETMTEDERKQLVADHFLFKGGDKYLEACGLERDWPEARGIFHNEAKNFLVWVNEEDQLRIISMQEGGDILEVFKRLSDAAGKIEEKAKFANDEHLGYISNCPTNLGTGLRASVHIHLPKLQKTPEKMDEIAKKYFVQIRGIHGEHSDTSDGIFDISNIRRLGRNEVQLVQDMYDGVKAMIEAEKAIEEPAAEE